MENTYYSNINYQALGLAILFYFTLKQIWYAPMLLGRTWSKLIEKKEKGAKGQAIVFNQITSLMCISMTVFMLNFMLLAMNITSPMVGFEMSMLIAIGFIGSPMLINSLQNDRSLVLFTIDLGFHTVSLSICGAILTGMI
jgi:hypothetical protein